MWRIRRSELLLLVLGATIVLESTRPIAGATANKAVGGGSANNSTTALQPQAKVHRPSVSPASSVSTSSTRPSLREGNDDDGVILPRAQKQSATVSRNVAGSFVGTSNQQPGRGLVLKDQLPPKSARFFNVRRTVHYIVCYFARNGFWPNYPQRMAPQVNQMSRQVFELDDNRVRIFCQPQFVRPPVNVQGPGIGVCCGGGGGGFPTRRPLTSTTKFDTETISTDYDTYTGTGTGTYTGGEDSNGNEDYNNRLQEKPGKKAEKLQKGAITPNENKTGRILVPKTNSRRAGRRRSTTPMNAMAVTSTVSPTKNNHRPIRSLRHRDVIVSFAEWQRKNAEQHKL